MTVGITFVTFVKELGNNVCNYIFVPTTHTHKYILNNNLCIVHCVDFNHITMYANYRCNQSTIPFDARCCFDEILD